MSRPSPSLYPATLAGVLLCCCTSSPCAAVTTLLLAFRDVLTCFSRDAAGGGDSDEDPAALTSSLLRGVVHAVPHVELATKVQRHLAVLRCVSEPSPSDDGAPVSGGGSSNGSSSSAVVAAGSTGRATGASWRGFRGRFRGFGRRGGGGGADKLRWADQNASGRAEAAAFTSTFTAAAEAALFPRVVGARKAIDAATALFDTELARVRTLLKRYDALSVSVGVKCVCFGRKRVVEEEEEEEKGGGRGLVAWHGTASALSA